MRVFLRGFAGFLGATALQSKNDFFCIVLGPLLALMFCLGYDPGPVVCRFFI